MYKESYYKENIFYTRVMNDKMFPTIQAQIIEQLSLNSAVGVIGGYYDSFQQYPIAFVSQFTLNILKMDIKEFSEMFHNNLSELFWEKDELLLSDWLDKDSGSFIYRLKKADLSALWVKVNKALFKDDNGNLMWILSVRSLDDILDVIYKDQNVLFSGIIDLNSEMIFIQKQPKKSNMNVEGNFLLYGKVVNENLLSLTNELDVERIRKKFSLSEVKKNIKKHKTYEVNSMHKLFGEKEVILRRRYQTILNDKRFILVTIEDVTDNFCHDYLTEAYNYNGFLINALPILKKNTNKYALIDFNICGFRLINDLYGFEVGNLFLKNVINIIKSSFLNPIIVARIQNDNFVCMVSKEMINIELLDKICANHITVGGRKLAFRLKCGIYEVEEAPNTKNELRKMIRYALMAQQYCMKTYQSSYVYNKELLELRMLNAQIETLFENAIKNEEFEVYYQPIVDGKTGEIFSAEALVRWNSKEQNLFYPRDFIPTLEKNGMISQLDLYVHQRTIDFLKLRYDHHKPIVPISVNLSYLDFENEDVFTKLCKTIEENREISDHYYIELTESSYLKFSDKILEMIKGLQNDGIKILIDDFGSGFSSFSTISDFPYDIIKLDMMFIHKIGNSSKADAIIKAIIDMCHHINVKVIAEGVETQEQYEKLMEFNCDYIQGYYFSKPLIKSDFEKVLDKGKLMGIN